MFARRVSCGKLVPSLSFHAQPPCTPGIFNMNSRLMESDSSPIRMKMVPTQISHNEVYSSELQALLSMNNRYELFQFLRRFVTTKQFLEDVKQLIDYRKVNFCKVLTLTDMYAWNSATEGTALMKQYAKKWYPDEFVAQGEFVPHTTLCENMSDPMIVLKKLLNMANVESMPKNVVLAQIELLLNKVILCGSQSMVNKVNAYVSRETCSELKGPIMCYSWVSFYLSPYDSDQIEASRFLELNGHLMQPHLDRMLLRLAHHLLNGRQLNRFYVLVQNFSKRSQQDKLKGLLEMLFYHFYNTSHMRGCKTCVRLANDLKVELPNDVMYKYTVLEKGRTTFSPHKEVSFIF